jgi:hypothetical protein
LFGKDKREYPSPRLRLIAVLDQLGLTASPSSSSVHIPPSVRPSAIFYPTRVLLLLSSSTLQPFTRTGRSTNLFSS